MKMKKNSRNTVARSKKAKQGQLRLVTAHPMVNRCLALIEKRFCEPIGLKDLVEFSEMSWRGFHKAFLRTVGTNPGRFLRTMRIEHAKKLLIEEDLKLKEIANRCGFRRGNTFSVAFQREVQMSPKQFQKEYCMVAFRQSQRTIGLEDHSLRFLQRFYGSHNSRADVIESTRA